VCCWSALEEDNGRSARSVRDLSCLWPRPARETRGPTLIVIGRRLLQFGVGDDVMLSTAPVSFNNASTLPFEATSSASLPRHAVATASGPRSQAPKCRRHKTEPQNVGVWLSLVVHFVRDERVAGSNPATPTKISSG
jgi:hypothetical protein